MIERGGTGYDETTAAKSDNIVCRDESAFVYTRFVQPAL